MMENPRSTRAYTLPSVRPFTSTWATFMARPGPGRPEVPQEPARLPRCAAGRRAPRSGDRAGGGIAWCVAASGRSARVGGSDGWNAFNPGREGPEDSAGAPMHHRNGRPMGSYEVGAAYSFPPADVKRNLPVDRVMPPRLGSPQCLSGRVALQDLSRTRRIPARVTARR